MTLRPNEKRCTVSVPLTASSEMETWRRRSTRSVYYSMCIATILATTITRPAAADQITDLQTLRAWTLHGCSPIHGWAPAFTATSTLCLEGTVNYGYSQSAGEYGFTWNFYNDPIVG